jgi:hypothetical protein
MDYRASGAAQLSGWYIGLEHWGGISATALRIQAVCMAGLRQEEQPYCIEYECYSLGRVNRIYHIQ